jgi:hypothetical protein
MKQIKSILLLSAMMLFLVFVSEAQTTQVATDTTKSFAKPATVQKPIVKPKIKKPKPIRTEFSGGLRLNSDGWSLFVDKGWVKSEEKFSDQFYNIRSVQFELSEKKHPKEIKRSNNLGSISDEKIKPFIFGKVNNFYTIKLGYGMRKMIAGKPEHGTVSVHWVYTGGLSAGLLKPYYIEAYVRENNGLFTQKSIKYSDPKDKDYFLAQNNIIGSSGFSKGLNEISVVPGLYVKTGLHFDFAKIKDKKLAVETGVSAELYSQKIEIMASQNAVPYFVNVYASIQFGKRW